MGRKVVRRTQYRRDLVRQLRYLAENADVETAIRFDSAVENAESLLAETPYLGAARRFRDRNLENVRMWPISEFDEYLLFYQPIKNGIRLIRLLHAKEDYRRILGAE